MTRHVNIHDLASGKWRGILLSLGLSDATLKGKHCPCPLCGGRDRFRYDDKDGRGTWICNQCGAGNGLDLAMRFKGWEFKEAVREVEAICGHTRAEPSRPRPELTDDERKKLITDLWAASAPIAEGDAADRYLRARGVVHDSPKALRCAPSLPHPEGGPFPAMLALVQDAQGRAVSFHQTFLQGDAKAPVSAARRLMRGTLPEGSAIRLGPANETLGIAEGIETALAASMLFELPVWSAINSSRLQTWTPPENVREVVICGDNDPKFGGQAAAYALAHRLACKGLEVVVRIPPNPGQDWLDVLTGAPPTPAGAIP